MRVHFAAVSERGSAGRWCADEGYAEKRAGPEDAASIAPLLASDEAANVTGQDTSSGGVVMWWKVVLPIDAGLLAAMPLAVWDSPDEE
jgi:hypothetical protein